MVLFVHSLLNMLLTILQLLLKKITDQYKINKIV